MKSYRIERFDNKAWVLVTVHQPDQDAAVEHLKRLKQQNPTGCYRVIEVVKKERVICKVS